MDTDFGQVPLLTSADFAPVAADLDTDFTQVVLNLTSADVVCRFLPILDFSIDADFSIGWGFVPIFARTSDEKQWIAGAAAAAGAR